MISIIIPCKNRLNFLSTTYPATKKVDGDCEIIIVDYNCPMGTAKYLNSVYGNTDANLKTIKCDVGTNDWNLSHARNIGYKNAKGNILLFIDADTHIKKDFLNNHKIEEGQFMTGTWLYASGCCMVHKKDFEEVKGYNEVVEGWGTEDFDLYERLRNKGLKQMHFNERYYKNIPHKNVIRNEYHGNKDIHATNEKNYQLTKNNFKSCLL